VHQQPMSDQNALLQQMLANHVKLLERYQRENNVERVAEWQAKVDKLRAQLGQPVQSSAPQQFNPQPSGGAYGASPAQQQYGAPTGGYGNQPPQTQGYGAPQPTQNQYTQPTGGYSNPAQPQYGNPAAQQAPSQPTYTAQPTQPAYNAPQMNYNQPPAQQTYQPVQAPPQDFSQSREYLAKDMEMQEMKLTNARLREQLAAKEETYAKETRAHQAQANELHAKINELLLASTTVDGTLSEKAAKIDELGREHAEAERRSVENLTQQTLKAGQAIRAKELEVEEKSKLVYLATDQVNQLTAQLQQQQEATLSQVRSLDDDKSRLQEALEHARNQDRQKEEQLEALQHQFDTVKLEQEDEANQVGVFVSKSMQAIKLAEENAKTQGSQGTLVVVSESNLGFGSLSIKTVLNK